jgi:UDP-glucose 4-epimerase
MEEGRMSSLVAVTGASGCLGSHVVAALSQAGFRVRGVDLYEPKSHIPAKVSWMPADLRDLQQTAAALAGVQAVVHCAGWHAVHLDDVGSTEFFENNVRSTFHVLDACHNHGIERVVFTSSTAVYGTAGDAHEPCAKWIDESTPRHWRVDNVYHATKVICEDLCEHYAHRYGARVVALRCTRFCQGSDQDDLGRLLSQGVHVRDAADGHVLAVLHGGQGFRAFNIGPPLPFTREDCAELFCNPARTVGRYFPEAAARLDKQKSVVPARIGRVYDTAAARSELDYMPRRGFGEVLARGWDI